MGESETPPVLFIEVIKQERESGCTRACQSRCHSLDLENALAIRLPTCVPAEHS